MCDEDDLVLRLGYLYESIVEIVSTDSDGAERASQLTESAHTFCALLASAAKSKPVAVPLLLLSLRIGTVLLSSAVSSAWTPSPALCATERTLEEWAVEGIHRLATLLPLFCEWEGHTPAAAALREELLAVVRSLVCGAVQQREASRARPAASDVAPQTNPDPPEAEAREQQRRAFTESRLYAAEVLVTRGLPWRSDAEQLLSSGVTGGRTLRRFMLHTLQEAFTNMRHIASGAAGVEVEEWRRVTTTTTTANGGLWFYAPLPFSAIPRTAAGNTGHTPRGRPGRSASNASGISSRCTSPRSSASRQNETFGSNQTRRPLQRVGCREGASVRWALAVLAALAASDRKSEEDSVSHRSSVDLGETREEASGLCHPGTSNGNRSATHSNNNGGGKPSYSGGTTWRNERFDKTSDFVDFMGDLVSVCAVVVRPFLADQLECIRQQQQQQQQQEEEGTVSLRVPPLPSSPNAASISVRLAEDAFLYERYSAIVGRFLLRYDPSAPPTPETVKNHHISHTETLEQELINEGEREEADFSPMWDVDKVQWTPMAPPLVAFLATLSSSSSSMMSKRELEIPLSEVAELFMEVKRFREAERGVIWQQWEELRRAHTRLASEVLCMQSRRDALLDVLLQHDPMDSPEAWEAQLQRHVDMLEANLKKSRGS